MSGRFSELVVQEVEGGGQTASCTCETRRSEVQRKSFENWQKKITWQDREAWTFRAQFGMG